MNLLLSYPRSGNTWFRYCVEAITKRKTHGYLQEDSGHFDKNHLGSYTDLGVNEEDPDILIKRHALEDLNESVEKLILIVRNYKEVVIRHRMESWKSGINMDLLKSSCTSSESSKNYLTIIEYFESFKGEKLIVYYEDLILDLEGTLEKASKFLKIGEENIESFIGNINFHKNKSLEIYGGSQTKGKSTSYHSNVLSKKEKIEWDNFIESYNPNIFFKYLQRYKEI